jgi:hypothetical protein
VFIQPGAEMMINGGGGGAAGATNPHHIVANAMATAAAPEPQPGFLPKN